MDIAEPGPAEPEEPDRGDELVDDPVAASRAVERAAERVLASEDLDARTQREIRTACEQLAADRTNGENLVHAIARLRELLARSTRG